MKCQRTRINEPPGTSRLYELTGRGSQKGCCEPLLASSCREGTDHSKVRIAKTRWTSQDGPNKRALKIKNPAEAKANLLTSRQSNAATKNSSHRQSQLLASPSQGSGGLSGHRKTLRRSLSHATLAVLKSLLSGPRCGSNASWFVRPIAAFGPVPSVRRLDVSPRQSTVSTNRFNSHNRRIRNNSYNKHNPCHS